MARRKFQVGTGSGGAGGRILGDVRGGSTKTGTGTDKQAKQSSRPKTKSSENAATIKSIIRRGNKNIRDNIREDKKQQKTIDERNKKEAEQLRRRNEQHDKLKEFLKKRQEAGLE